MKSKESRLMAALEKFMAITKRRFPTFTEVLVVIDVMDLKNHATEG